MTLFDPGLQPERTELAWRRTSLALGVGSLVSMRLLPVALGEPLWILAGMGGLLAAVAVWVLARRRCRRAAEVLVAEGDRARLAGAGALLALTLLAIATALLALWVVVATAAGAPARLVG